MKEPKLAWQMRRSDAPEAVEQWYLTVTEFGLNFTASDFKQLFEWVRLESQRMQQGGEDAGKSSAV